jgi:beta-galactosidase
MTAVLALLQTLISGANAAGAGGPEGVTPLNQGWLFGGEYTPGSEALAFADSSFQPVTIPHSVVPLGWNNYDNNTWNKVWIYRRHFDLPSRGPGGSVRTFLDFDSVLTVTTPTVNGHALPTHHGGYLPFSYEITNYVNQTDNVLAVVVDARWSYVNPEGSPVGPQSIDYLEPGGINRDVALRTVPSSFISDVFAKPVNVLNSSRQVVVECTIDSAKAPGQIQINSQLQDAGKVLSQTTETWNLSQPGNETRTLNISAPDVRLWSPDSPKLYQVVTTLVVRGQVVHKFTRNIGFREALFTTDGFFLNGNRLQIFGLNRHQLFPYIGMSAPERLQKRDAEMLKELNCNMIRCSHYPQSPYFLDMCDQLGIMVWQEVPGWNFIGNASWQQHVVSDVHDMIIRDRSRPSVILWGVQVNESPREPALYTQTKDLAKSLDDSRQSSGSEISQSLDNWVVDVFAFDDYHSEDGNASLLPPLTTVPYLVTEAVGALDGPKYYRWIDDQDVQQVQAKLHAQVHDIAGGNRSYSGLLGWCSIDYDSLNGNLYENIKWPGVIDTFRVYKPGAAFYLTQGDPSKGARIEPAFYWDFGSVSPVTTLGQNATIWSNCETLEAYVDGAHYATLSPDATNFPHTAHPPFYLDTTKLNASARPELRLDGYVSGKQVSSRSFSGSTRGDHIQITLNDQQLEADGIDTTLISFRAVDKYGNPRPYATGDVHVSVNGPGEWVGQSVALNVTAELSVDSAGQFSKNTTYLKNSAFPWTENGGVGGATIRTIAGQHGTIVVDVSHATLGQDTVHIEAVASPGSLVTADYERRSDEL